MVVWVVADEKALIEWPAQPGTGACTVSTITTVNEIKAGADDIIVDLLFDNSEQGIATLANSNASLVLINHVIGDLKTLPRNFVRINAWPGFLQRNVVEAATLDDANKENAIQFFTLFDKKIEWVPDIAGFFTARVICSIINEAFFALEEEVSTREEIDTAMKLGTNYPYGPFEWADRLGIENVFALLTHLSREELRYQPAGLLAETASKS